MKLKNIKECEGCIELKSGLHIGGGDTNMRIGGADSLVIKNPRNGNPYIPGSSLKGKIRSLLELETGLVELGEPLGSKQFKDGTSESDKIIQLFGVGASDSSNPNIGPTRISFADCPICVEDKNKENIFEIKAENCIDRIKGTAANPRFIERVVAGVKFDFSISLKLFDEDDEKEFERILLRGIALLERDALGASGSRGYGKVCFTFKDKDIQTKLEDARNA